MVDKLRHVKMKSPRELLNLGWYVSSGSDDGSVTCFSKGTYKHAMKICVPSELLRDPHRVVDYLTIDAGFVNAMPELFEDVEPSTTSPEQGT